MTPDTIKMARQMAYLAKAAYVDDNRKQMAAAGYDRDYEFISEDDANAHIACDANTIVLSIRGTEFTHLKDLLANAKAWPKSQGNGWIHAGFREYARKIYLQVRAYVEAHPDRIVVITGHSLGGAMALYIAGELMWDLKIQDVTVHTFGCPRVGNAKYVRSLGFTHHRFVNCNDMVAKLPPAWLFYKHHGTLHYINHRGQLGDLTVWQRIKDMWCGHLSAWSQGQLFDGLHDHSMARYMGKLDQATI